MLRFFSIALATKLVTATPVAAQKGQQVFDLLLQGAQQEVYRQQQREHARRQRHEVNRQYQQFVAEWQSCHGGDLNACDRALTFPQVNTPDRNSLLRKRAEIVAAEQAAIERTRRERYEAELAERQQRDRTAAEAQDRLRRDAEQKRQGEDAYRLRVERQLQTLLDEREREKAAASMGPSAGSALALVLLAIVGLLGFVFRVQLRAASNAAVAKAREVIASLTQASQQAPDATQPEKQPEPEKSTVATMPRDTPGAISAMELALAYIQEVQEAERPGLEDKAGRKHQLNTLALAAKQLDLAQRLDADAILEGQNEDLPFRFTINELKSEALLLEGMTHQLYDVRRAIPALVAATTLNPSSARAFYVLGLTHSANMSKTKAIAAFERAVALDPKNIAYRKELNRVQNLSGAEVAAYRATRTAEKVVDNTVMAWNVFAVIWNVLTFPLRLLVGIFRMLRLHPFA
mgnify:FL=1